jgi:N-methylhydantoinase B
VNALPPAAVAGGNVETSQRIVDVLFRALAQAAPDRIAAASSGSMSNLTVGGYDTFRARHFSYYETIAGGAGAAPGHPGTSGIHTHMTNTLNTPIEAIERTFPLRVTRYEFADETAGDGRFRGGSGLVRSMQLRSGEATIALLAERHTVRPAGLAGGRAGGVGRHRLLRGEHAHELPAKTTLPFSPGEILEVQTAGGGGYGDPADRDPSARERDARDGIRISTSGL